MIAVLLGAVAVVAVSFQLPSPYGAWLMFGAGSLWVIPFMVVVVSRGRPLGLRRGPARDGPAPTGTMVLEVRATGAVPNGASAAPRLTELVLGLGLQPDGDPRPAGGIWLVPLRIPAPGNLGAVDQVGEQVRSRLADSGFVLAGIRADPLPG